MTEFAKPVNHEFQKSNQYQFIGQQSWCDEAANLNAKLACKQGALTTFVLAMSLLTVYSPPGGSLGTLGNNDSAL